MQKRIFKWHAVSTSPETTREHSVAIHLFPFLGSRFLRIACESRGSLPGSPHMRCMSRTFRILAMTLVHPRNAHSRLGINTSAPVGTLSLHFQVAEFADWAGSSDTRQGPEAGKQKTAQNTREWDLLVGLRSFQHRTEEIRKGLKTSLFHEFWCWGLNTRPCICESEYLATQLFPWQWIFCVLN